MLGRFYRLLKFLLRITYTMQNSIYILVEKQESGYVMQCSVYCDLIHFSTNTIKLIGDCESDLQALICAIGFVCKEMHRQKKYAKIFYYDQDLANRLTGLIWNKNDFIDRLVNRLLWYKLNTPVTFHCGRVADIWLQQEIIPIIKKK